MSFGDLYLVTPDLSTFDAADVARLERELGSPMPSGYAEYMQRLGTGSLNSFVHVWPPDKILADLAEFRSWVEVWSWDEPESEVDPQRALESFPIGDTHDGDLLCFHPDDPETVIVLPRHHEIAYRAGPGLGGALEWIFASDKLIRPEPIASFHAHVPTHSVTFDATGVAIEAVREAVAALDPRAWVHQYYHDDSVVNLPGMKGFVRLSEQSADKVHAHLEYQSDVPEDGPNAVQLALSRAGMRYTTSW